MATPPDDARRMVGSSEVGTRYPAEPWWELRRFLSLNPAHGDVKDVWEPARFTWAFDFALGYAVSRDDRYAEAFWSAVESFMDGNPPFRGIQWSCGQETSIRALSCLWGERIFASAASLDRRTPGATSRSLRVVRRTRRECNRVRDLTAE